MFRTFGLLGLGSQVLFFLSLIFVVLWVMGKLILAFWPWLLVIAAVWRIYRLVRRKVKA